jgi:hypothetical protein
VPYERKGKFFETPLSKYYKSLCSTISYNNTISSSAKEEETKKKKKKG